MINHPSLLDQVLWKRNLGIFIVNYLTQTLFNMQWMEEGKNNEGFDVKKDDVGGRIWRTRNRMYPPTQMTEKTDSCMNLRHGHGDIYSKCVLRLVSVGDMLRLVS